MHKVMGAMSSNSIGGVDIANNTAAYKLPVPFVRTFTVRVAGADSAVITTPLGDITVRTSEEVTFGVETDIMPTGDFSIATGVASNASVIIR